MQAGILDEVLAGSGGDGGNIADVLHHGGDGDGRHHKDGSDIKLGNHKVLQAHQLGFVHSGEVHLAEDQRHDVADHHAQQDGDDLDHALAPDVGHDNDHDGHQCQPPVGGRVIDGGTGQVQTDQDDDGAGDDGREEPHDLLGAHQLEQQGQHQIQQSGHHNAAQCVGQLLLAGHVGELTDVQLRHSLKAAQEGKGGTQESRHLKLCAQMEQQRTETGEQQRGLDGQRQAVGADQNGHQHGGAEHGKQVLQAQQEHTGDTQSSCVVDGLLAKIFLHGVIPLFHVLCM